MIDYISINNFMRIANTKLPLNKVTVIVGANSSGKSSVLKGIHWAVRCAFFSSRGGKKKVSLEEMDYLPSKDFLKLGRGRKLSNKTSDKAKFTLTFHQTDENDSEQAEKKTTIRIGAARNDAGVNVFVSGDLKNTLFDKDKFFSAYIPGLSGVSETETILARSILHRKAAAGDGGSVLRSILHSLVPGDGSTGGDFELTELNRWISKVIPGTRIWVKYDPDFDNEIDVQFITRDMEGLHPNKKQDRRSLDMAGTGVLKIIQMFAYLLKFQPRLLLVDEPDAHLHPSRQSALMKALEAAAVAFPETQFVITTHSPKLVQACGGITDILWMENGSVKEAGKREIQNKMGWNALDKDVLIFTEDGNVTILEKIISQWPEIESRVGILSMGGISKLPDGKNAEKIEKHNNIKLLMHMDSDFVLPEEQAAVCELKQYPACGIAYWSTEYPDIEGYFLDRKHLVAALGLSEDQINDLMLKTYQSFDEEELYKQFEIKRSQRLSNIAQSKVRANYKLWEEYQNKPEMKVKSKDLLEKFTRIGQVDLKDGYLKAKILEPTSSVELASDLKGKLLTLLNSVG